RGTGGVARGLSPTLADRRSSTTRAVGRRLTTPAGGGAMGSSEREWREALASWAIPDDILAKAPESPWSFPVELFASRAQAAPSSLTPSNRCALDALPEGGSVLDVGCGAGAASLALVPKAGALIGVDPSAEMLRAFTEKAGAAGVPATAIEGSWPEASPRAPGADVVVCHHVVYNVPGLGEF